MTTSSLIQVDNLLIRFPVRGSGKKQYITPVDQVSFGIERGEVLALVGESGSGKTTIGRSLVRILQPSEGLIRVAGQDITNIRGGALHQYRKTAQMIFQDPFGSLNPMRTVEKHLFYSLRKHRKIRSQREIVQATEELLVKVGLTPVEGIRKKYPHELSGGQRQRLAIARALAVEPQFIVADEPISMLDVSIRAGILKLLKELKEELGISYLFITHDLASARYFGDRIMVMYGGKIVESADSRTLIQHPTHPYTQLLLASTPGNELKLDVPEIDHDAPNLLEGRSGCPFAHRCPKVTEECREIMPEPEVVESGHRVACHHVD